MNFRQSSLRVFSVLAVSAAVVSHANAQSTFSIPNPLVKLNKSVAADASSAMKVPKANLVEGANAQGMPMPPSPMSTVMPSSKSGSDDASIEALTYYTVTAILGDVAILRTNVGLAVAPVANVAANAPQGGIQGGSAAGMAGSPGSASTSQVKPRQAVLRVKTDQPVNLAGVQYFPRVMSYGVEFRLSSKAPALYTAVLESQTPHQYALQPGLKETIDPATPARMAPIAQKTELAVTGNQPSQSTTQK